MKNYKNIFAAGALGLVLAVTGCNYNPVNDTLPPVTTGETATRGRLTTNRYANRYQTNALWSRNRNRTFTTRSTGRTGAAKTVRTAPSGNQYTYGTTTANTTTKGTALNRGMTGSTSSKVHGRGTPRLTEAPQRKSVSAPTRRTSGTAVSRNIYNTGNVTQFPTPTRGNSTGSPFGDYNKDRAYSLTRRPSGINNVNNLNTVASTENKGTQSGTAVRKSFTEGTAQTRAQGTGTAITSNVAHGAKSTRNTHGTTKSTGSTIKSATKKTGTTRTAKTGAQSSSPVTAATRRTTASGTAVTKNIGSAKNAVNTANTGTTAAAVKAGTANATGNTQAAGTSINNFKSETVRNSRVSDPNRGRLTAKDFEGEAYNERATMRNGKRISTSVNTRGTGTSRSSVYDNRFYNGGRTRDTRSTKGTYGNYGTGRTTSNRGLVNNAGVNNVNNLTRYARPYQRYSNYGYNDDFLRNYGGYDDLTIGSSYRNADLRNNIYSSDMLYGYSGTYGTNNISRGTRSGVSRGVNTDSVGRYGRYYGANYGANYGSYGTGYPGFYRGYDGLGYAGTARTGSAPIRSGGTTAR